MSFITGWIKNIGDVTLGILGRLGLWKIEANIVIVGLDNAGKTTLSGLMQNGSIECHLPTSHPTLSEFKVGSVTMKTFDMGGHKAARRLWKSYYNNVDAIIFVVDVSDRDRIQEVQIEFSKIVNDDFLGNVPILVLGNKIDRKDAMSLEQTSIILGLQPSDTNVGIFMCSVVKRYNVGDALGWLSNELIYGNRNATKSYL
jgi:GTP-binding protein SAR1